MQSLPRFLSPGVYWCSAGLVARVLSSYLFRKRSNAWPLTCRYLPVVGRARIIFAVSVRKRVKIAAIVSSGASPSRHQRQLHFARAHIMPLII
jgi:hypothetical protein